MVKAWYAISHDRLNAFFYVENLIYDKLLALADLHSTFSTKQVWLLRPTFSESTGMCFQCLAPFVRSIHEAAPYDAKRVPSRFEVIRVTSRQSRIPVILLRNGRKSWYVFARNV